MYPGYWIREGMGVHPSPSLPLPHKGTSHRTGRAHEFIWRSQRGPEFHFCTHTHIHKSCATSLQRWTPSAGGPRFQGWVWISGLRGPRLCRRNGDGEGSGSLPPEHQALGTLFPLPPESPCHPYSSPSSPPSLEGSSQLT